MVCLILLIKSCMYCNFHFHGEMEKRGFCSHLKEIFRENILLCNFVLSRLISRILFQKSCDNKFRYFHKIPCSTCCHDFVAEISVKLNFYKKNLGWRNYLHGMAYAYGSSDLNIIFPQQKFTNKEITKESIWRNFLWWKLILRFSHTLWVWTLRKFTNTPIPIPLFSK